MSVCVFYQMWFAGSGPSDVDRELLLAWSRDQLPSITAMTCLVFQATMVGSKVHNLAFLRPCDTLPA